MIKQISILIFITAIFLSGCRSIPESVITEETIPQASTLSILDNLPAQEEIMRAFAKAYPFNISDVAFINNDWTMLVNGIRFYFANGRFLPENIRDEWEQHHPWDFYAYPWAGTPGQRQIAIANPVYSVGSSFLFDTLYFSPNEDASWEMQVMYSFLGIKTIVHSYIAPLLDLVSEEIIISLESDLSINTWLLELITSPPSLGWNWRTIAGTNRRSNHSYGTAIDLLPRNLRGRYTYWRWGTDEEISRETYYMPPDSVIRAFRNYGFIWGGHWDLIDTMHFEYRPEILLLNNITDFYIPIF